MDKPRPKSEIRKVKAPKEPKVKAPKVPKVKKEKVLKQPRIDPAVKAANEKRMAKLPKGAKYYAQTKLDLWGPQVTGRLLKGDKDVWDAVDEFCALPEDERKPKKAKKAKVKKEKKAKKAAKSPATLAADAAEAEIEVED